MLEIIELEISNHHKQGLWRRSRAFHTLKVKLAPLTLTLTASLISWRLEMRAKNFVVNRGISCVNRGISCVNRGVSCFIRGVSCFIRGVSCFIRCILSCFIRCNPVFQSWSSRRERVKACLGGQKAVKQRGYLSIRNQTKKTCTYWYEIRVQTKLYQ